MARKRACRGIAGRESAGLVSEHKALDHALVSGIAWTAVLRWSSQVVSWIATFFVARLLMPSQYGLVSMAMIAIGLVRMVEDFGLDSILVQDRSIVGDRQARLAGFITSIGVGLCALFLLLAHPIAAFFKEPEVAQLISVLSLLFITDALQVVPRAALQRELRFQRLAVALFVQVIVTQGALVAAALAGWGVWALVANSVAGAVAITVLLIWWHPYSIRWPRDVKTLARPLLQGWRVMASRMAYYAYTTADQTIIGRMLGKDALGVYSFSTTFANLPFQEASAVVSKVVPGIFSEVQHRRDELRRYFLVLTECLSYLTLPMSVGLALTADLLVHVALGPNWEGVIVPLQVLCLYAAFQGSQILISHLLMWTGQFRALMWCSILTGVMLPLGFLLGANYGVIGITWAWAVVYPLSNIPPLIIGLRTVSVSFPKWFDALKPSAVGCVVMAAAVLAMRSYTPQGTSDAVRLVATIGVGMLVYAAALWVFFRRRVLDIISVVRAVRQPVVVAPA
ncbi:MAG: lipopolysaccharide biosynthesis protein [Gammaproteobacteria bacterium]